MRGNVWQDVVRAGVGDGINHDHHAGYLEQQGVHVS